MVFVWPGCQQKMKKKVLFSRPLLDHHFSALEANMGPKSLHFETPWARNFSMFAQLNIICPTCAKSAPLLHENHIFAYFRSSKNYQKSAKISSETLLKSISSWERSWNTKNHDFHVKNIDFRVPKNSGFFKKLDPKSVFMLIYVKIALRGVLEAVLEANMASKSLRLEDPRHPILLIFPTSSPSWQLLLKFVYFCFFN